MKRPFALVFANAKGGVGKTTSAVHVAGAFAETGVTTLLIDLDPQASATRHLGIDPEALTTTITDVLIEPSQGLASATQQTRYERLACIPAHQSLGDMESELGSISGREELLTEAWAASDDPPFRMIVIDVPPALSVYTVNALRFATAAVVPVQTHPFAFRAVPRTLELIDKVRRRLNPDIEVLGYVATLYDRRTRVARECLAAMEEAWGERLFTHAIPVNIALAEAAREGRLLFDSAPNSMGAAAYYGLATEIVERLAARRDPVRQAS